MIALSVKDLNALNQLMIDLDKKRIKYIPFYEPDIKEVTAIVLSPSIDADKATSNLPLAGKKAGIKDKHT
jgi:hypothetical protein